MITLISSIVGILSSFLPSLISIYSKHQDYKYELELAKVSSAAAQKNLDLQKEIARINADNSDELSVRSNDNSAAGDNSFIGILRSSVRPLITYFFFFFFVSVKVIVAYLMIKKNIDPTIIINTIWDENTMIIFSAIVSFWFGTSAMRNLNIKSKITGELQTPKPGIGPTGQKVPVLFPKSNPTDIFNNLNNSS